MGVGGNPNEYYKLYGSPDPNQLAEAQAKAKAEGRQITADEWLAIGGNPAVYQQSTAVDPYKQSINQPGTRTSGTSVGKVLQINPATIPLTQAMEAAKIAPVERVGDINAGAANTINGQTITGTSPGYDAQLKLLGDLQAQAAGQGPSLAGEQLKAALEQILAQQQGSIASMRGVNPGLAMRLAGSQAGAAQQNTAQQAAIARIQEILNAQQQLAGLGQNIRSTDIGVQTTNATNAQNAATANQNAINAQNQYNATLAAQIAQGNQLAQNTAAYNQAQFQQAANNTNVTNAYNRALQQAQLNQNAAIANQNAFNSANLGQAQVSGGVKEAGIAADATKTAAQIAADAQMYGDTIQAASANQGEDVNQAGGTGSPTSDKRAKKNIKSGDKASEDMMDSLAAALFEYKNKAKDGAGEKLGVMAQDLEKSKLGKKIVRSTNEGKMLDFNNGLAAALANQANLHKRLKAVEKRS